MPRRKQDEEPKPERLSILGAASEEPPPPPAEETLVAEEQAAPEPTVIHLLDANRELREVVTVAAGDRRRLVTVGGVTYHHVDTVGDIWRYAPEG